MYANTRGIIVDPQQIGAGDPIVVRGNTVHDNQSHGIEVIGNGPFALVEGNTVYGHRASGAFGIVGYLNEIRDNTVFENTGGIFSWGPVTDNRVYHNKGDGIQAYGGPVRGNSVYSNSVGIRVQQPFWWERLRPE